MGPHGTLHFCRNVPELKKGLVPFFIFFQKGVDFSLIFLYNYKKKENAKQENRREQENEEQGIT